MQDYAFLPQIGEDPAAFWKEFERACAARKAPIRSSPTCASCTRRRRPRTCASTAPTSCAQGKNVELYAGVADWFDAIGDYVKLRSESHGVSLRHYVVSAGLTEIIEGTTIYKRFHNVFASEFWFEAYELPFPKRVITDTGKTQYLFRINKGLEDLRVGINEHMDEAERPIPFSNMIYFGDGDTDVPSMAVMRKNGGHAVAVYPPDKPKKKCVDLFKAGRCDFFAPADYRRGSDLFKRTCLLLGPHPRRHPRAGGDVAAGARGAVGRLVKKGFYAKCLLVYPRDQGSRKWNRNRASVVELFS